MSQTFNLFRLQQIDSQIDKAQARLRVIEAALAEDEVIRSAKSSLESADKDLETANNALQKAEQAVQDQRLKIEQTESTLYGGKVRNPKELQDLQNEVAALKRYMNVLEDRQLEAMMAVDEAEGTQQAASQALNKVLAAVTEQQSRLRGERTALQAEIASLENERTAASSPISEEDMRLYNQLRTQRRGIAVSKVTNQACSACGATLSAAVLHASRSPDQITRCATCSRILYGG
jgi:predicted  nucleic acid-binding Zn-ribbon protein